MKLKITVGAIAVLLVSLLGGYYYWSLEQTLNRQEDIYDNETAEFPSAYVDEARGIKLTYPAGWQSIPADESSDTVVTFIPESESSNQVVVTAKKLDDRVSLDEYTTATVYAITQDLLQAKIIDSQKISLDNSPAHQIIYTAQENGKPIKYLQVWLLKNDRAYAIAYKAREDNYDDFVRVVKDVIIKSFKVRDLETATQTTATDSKAL